MKLVITFCQLAKDLHPKYIEGWLNGEIKDYDMDMQLLDEKKRRQHVYKKLVNVLGETSS